MAKLQTPSRSAAPAGPNQAERRGSRRYVKIADAADYLQVTARTIRAMVADGRLTAISPRNWPRPWPVAKPIRSLIWADSVGPLGHG